MQVAFDGADADAPGRFNALLNEQRFQHRAAGVHRTGCDQHFRHEHFVVLEFFTDDVHPRQQPLF